MAANHAINRLTLFCIALSVRAILAYLFFGGGDLKSEIIISSTLCDKNLFQQFLPYPYVPLIAIFSWFAGVLAYTTSLPIGFCFKLIPIIFDALIAVLIYDFLRYKSAHNAYIMALLYVCNPIPLIINCINFQWDSVALFFVLFAFYIREYATWTLLSQLLYGIFFALSFLFKSYTAILLLFFFRPIKDFSLSPHKLWQLIRHSSAAIVGTAITVGVTLVVLLCQGYPLQRMLMAIIRYANHGMLLFGLPFAWPLSVKPLNLLFHHRILLLVPICFIAYVYYQQKIALLPALTMTFALMIGCAGWYGPYLFWIVPFLFLVPQQWFLAVYTMLATLFYLIFFSNPFANRYALYEGLTGFATLQDFAWFMPPISWIRKDTLLLLHLLGDYIIPLLCITIIMVIWCNRQDQQLQQHALLSNVIKPYAMVLLPIFMIVLVAKILSGSIEATSFKHVMLKKVNEYSVATLPLGAAEAAATNPYHQRMFAPGLIGNFDNGTWCNIVVLFALLSCCVSIVAWRIKHF